MFQFLLSSSVDKTVRMWQVGCDGCLKVFSHSNYGALLSLNFCCILVHDLVLISDKELPLIL